MSTTLLTILLATIIVLLALLGLAIGWLLTGKSKLKGSCGRGGSCDTPTKGCSICRPEDEQKKQ